MSKRTYRRREDTAAALLDVLKLNEAEGAQLSRVEIMEMAGLTHTQFYYALTYLRDHKQVTDLAPVVVSKTHAYGIAVTRQEITDYLMRMLAKMGTQGVRAEQLIEAGEAKFGKSTEWVHYRKSYRRWIEDTVDLVKEMSPKPVTNGATAS